MKQIFANSQPALLADPPRLFDADVVASVAVASAAQIEFDGYFAVGQMVPEEAQQVALVGRRDPLRMVTKDH